VGVAIRIGYLSYDTDALSQLRSTERCTLVEYTEGDYLLRVHIDEKIAVSSSVVLTKKMQEELCDRFLQAERVKSLVFKMFFARKIVPIRNAKR
jgi:hypothetical protein